MEGLDFTNGDEITVNPNTPPRNRRVNQVEILGQEEVSVIEIPLVLEDDEVKSAISIAAI
ncbi:hypothetical protein Q0V21_17885 [Paenibacillus sp. 11B]|nr:hypothetical protein [Paenibacillus sp. 11B]